jgi:hypothetical protein
MIILIPFILKIKQITIHLLKFNELILLLFNRIKILILIYFKKIISKEQKIKIKNVIFDIIQYFKKAKKKTELSQLILIYLFYLSIKNS